jgi:hypothetical protein
MTQIELLNKIIADAKELRASLIMATIIEEQEPVVKKSNKNNLTAVEKSQNIKVGDLVWFKGTKDRHGIRRVISIKDKCVSPQHVLFECEQVRVVSKGTRIMLEKPAVIRDKFAKGIYKESNNVDRARVITLHSAYMFGGFINE